MSKSTLTPTQFTAYESRIEPVDPRLVSAAGLLLRWLIESGKIRNALLLPALHIVVDATYNISMAEIADWLNTLHALSLKDELLAMPHSVVLVDGFLVDGAS